MRFSYRKPITSTTPEQVGEAIAAHFPNRKLDYSLDFYVGRGWCDIVFDLNKKIESETPDYEILQIKEKFGGLRYYTTALSHTAWDYVSEAEKLSYKTCEECGRPGRIWNDRGWVKTLCWLDYRISEINKTLWIFERGGLKAYFKSYFAYRRWKRNRNGRA